MSGIDAGSGLDGVAVDSPTPGMDYIYQSLGLDYQGNLLPESVSANIANSLDMAEMLAQVGGPKIDIMKKLRDLNVPGLIQKHFLAVLLGLGGTLAGGWVLWRRFGKINKQHFEDILNVGITYMMEGNSMKMISLMEREIEKVFDSPNAKALGKRIEKASKGHKVNPNDIILDLEKYDGETGRVASQIYGEIRTTLTQFTDPLRDAARILSGEELETVSMVGIMTKEPQYDKKTGKLDPDTADTQLKNRFLVFPEDDIQHVMDFCEGVAANYDDKTQEDILDEICNEGDDFSAHTDHLIGEFIGGVDNLPRVCDRKRFVAMAQVARAIKIQGKKHTKFDVNVPKKRDILSELLGEEDAQTLIDTFGTSENLQKYLLVAIMEVLDRAKPERMAEHLRNIGGRFFPSDAEMEGTRLSFEKRRNRRTGELHNEGPNGACTNIVTQGTKVLVALKGEGANPRWAIPGGFIKNPEDSRRYTAAKETKEESIDFDAVDGLEDYFSARQKEAEGVYMGPVVSHRNYPNGATSYIYDHVYHVNMSGWEEDIPLKEKGVDFDVPGHKENIGNSQFQDIMFFFTADPNTGIMPVDNMFESQGTVIREWAREQVLRYHYPERGTSIFDRDNTDHGHKVTYLSAIFKIGINWEAKA